ncbi:MAG: hypothetical protein HY689_11270 [Chloroflexi bacterium]|nr:hypothetical protein [Chloroflexota bacterium]
MSRERGIPQRNVPTWSWGQIGRLGVIGGLMGGVVMLIGEMAQAAILGDALLAPASMIAAMLLGPEVIGTLTLPVLATGMVWHLVLSAIFGVIFAAVVAYWPTLRQSATTTLGAGAVYGTALWLVNFYVIGLAVGWTWFAAMTNPIAQVIVHAFFFGLPLGWYLSRQLPAVVAAVPEEERRREAA